MRKVIYGINLTFAINSTLVDEFHFVIHPVIVGEGRRLLDDTQLRDRLNLKLVESKVLESGAVALHYLKQ